MDALKTCACFENMRLELRRGCLVLAVLVQLRTEHYGYALRKALSGGGLDIDENTLYPLLRRLESQNLLVSHWRVEDKRNKRFYRLSEEGYSVLEQLLAEWRGINASIGKLEGTSNDESRTAGPLHLGSEDPVAAKQAG